MESGDYSDTMDYNEISDTQCTWRYLRKNFMHVNLELNFNPSFCG